MTIFIQFHLLTAYAPSNLNRDDTGRPKSAQFGQSPRLRVSSQALKRAWRTSNAFETALAGHLGTRSQRFGEAIHQRMIEQGLSTEKALAKTRDLIAAFGKPSDKDKPQTYTAQLAFLSPAEQAAILTLADRMAAGEEIDLKKQDKPLRHADGAVDIAMFGRMLADDPAFNREAAVQVAHAITTHRVVVEDDFYTAVDDLKKPAEDAGAGFIGETGFGAGLFYLYGCIDQDLLIRNLNGDEKLAYNGIAALLRAAATVGPTGKQASFASRAHASYILVERGSDAPRSLAVAYLDPVRDDDLLKASIQRLKDTQTQFNTAYGATDTTSLDMIGPGSRLPAAGTLDAVIQHAIGG